MQKKEKRQRRKINKYLYWAPRVLSIIFILFLGLLSFDVFNAELSFWQTIVALFMHNIPAIVLLVILLFSWNHEIAGGIGFIFAGVLYMALVIFIGSFEWFKLLWILQISGVAFLIGILWMLNWKKKRR